MSAQERVDRRKLAEMNQKLHRANKFKNVWTEVDGIKFQSKAEAKRYSQLKLLEMAGEIEGLKLQPRFPIHLNGKLICNVVGDFYYTTMRDLVCEDVKGMDTPISKLKRKLFHAQYGYEITVIR